MLTMRSKEGKVIKILSIKVLLVSVLFLVCIFLFAFLAEGVVYGKPRKIDNEIFSFFNSFSTPALIKAAEVFSFFGSAPFLICAYLFLIGFYFFTKRFRIGVDVIIIASSSSLLMFVLKVIFHRQRPDLPIIHSLNTYSFPSGHALSSFIFCSTLITIVRNTNWKKIYKRITTILLLLLSLCIGSSRIVLRAHYPTDVIASFCLGIVWVIVSVWILRKINREYLVKSNLAPAKESL